MKLKLQNAIKIALVLFAFILFTVAAAAQIITTFAGNGTAGSSGNGGAATSAQLNVPVSVCSDNVGNVYIADHDNRVIRKVNSTGIISTFAGTGVQGNSGDGGPAAAATMGLPLGIYRDNIGNIYITDHQYHVIRKVDNAGIITTVAGTGIFGYSGDGGPAINAKLFAPSGICVDNGGNIYFADHGNQIIRKINTSGIISTVAGTPQVSGNWGDGGLALDALLASPTDVSCDNLGNFYIADRGNNIVRKVNASGIITKVAGGGFGYAGDGGLATAASFRFIYNVLADNLGNLYISDTGNGVLRFVNTSGIVTTIAGTGVLGYSGDGGPAVLARLTSTCGINIDNAGNIFIADNGVHVIRKISACTLASIVNQPQDQFICAADNTSFSVTANNTTGYQWQVNNGSGWVNLVNNGTYSGTTTSTLTITNTIATMDGYQYHCIVTNSCGNTTSVAAILHVATLSAPTLQIGTPTNVVCAGANVVFAATPFNGGSSPSYQWKKNGINTGIISATYNDNSLVNGDIINCVLTSNSTCVTIPNATSNSIIMTVNSPVTPTITVLPSVNNICFGTPVTFSTSITNGGSNPVYQWKKNSVNVGTNSPTYSNNAINNGDIITCELTSNQTCLTSSVVTSTAVLMNVIPLISPSISISTTSPTICPGTSVNFSAASTNGGTSPVYQWKKNGSPVGTNNISYTDNAVVNGDIITCTLTSNANCLLISSATSNSITMSVLQLTVVSLDKTNTLCAQSSRILDAGVHSGYLWNDASTGRTLTVTSPGTYYVTVTSNNGCKGSDTSRITTLIPLPNNFLPPDTSKCSYGTIALIAKPGYKNYLWNTNSNTSSISITTAGVYWLNVTDNNNCKGTDTILVMPKQCLRNFFIPTAFTPNDDTKNDLFKPVFFGNVIQFKFVVYDRYGNPVFQSSDVTKGWDGKIKGLKQNNNVFVWTCSYQFERGILQFEKGTVLLLR